MEWDLGEDSASRRGRRQVCPGGRPVTDRARSEYFLETLVGAPSVSGSEDQGVEVCRTLMAEVGLATRVRPCTGVPGAYNVEGRLGTGSPKLCLAGHVDTLPLDGMSVNPLGERRGNRYYGRGTSDMKGGLAAVLAAVNRLVGRGVTLGGERGHFIHVERGMKPFVTDPRAEIVCVFQGAVQGRGGNADVEMMPGWGDIEFVASDHGVPALYFGPGDLAAAHTADEYLDLDRYHEAILIYKNVIATFLAAERRP